MADIDTLREEVREALRFIEGVRVFVTSRERIKNPEGDDLFDASIATLRAELIRLAMIEADALIALDCEHDWRVEHERAEKAEAELAAVKARIAEAPVAYLTSKTGVGPCNVASMAHGVVFDSSSYGKSVRVVLDK